MCNREIAPHHGSTGPRSRHHESHHAPASSAPRVCNVTPRTLERAPHANTTPYFVRTHVQTLSSWACGRGSCWVVATANTDNRMCHVT
jgi:hypothetical protein